MSLSESFVPPPPPRKLLSSTFGWFGRLFAPLKSLDGRRVGVIAEALARTDLPAGSLLPLFEHYEDEGSAGTGETSLFADTIDPQTFVAVGDKLRVRRAGVLAASATATRQLREYFAGLLVLDTGALTSADAATWQLDLLLVRTGTNTARALASASFTGATAPPPLSVIVDESTLTGIDFSASIVSEITGTAGGSGAADNDIVARLSTTNYQGAA